jgi:hypothetical protein
MVKSFKEHAKTSKQYPKFARYMDGQRQMLEGDHEPDTQAKMASVKSRAAHKAFSAAEHAITHHHGWSEDQAFEEGHLMANDYEANNGHIPTTVEQNHHHPSLIRAMKHFDKHVTGSYEPTQYNRKGEPPDLEGWH